MKKVTKIKIVQFFKTYNFHVVQIFTRSKDFKIFSILSNLLKFKRTHFIFKIARVVLSTNTSFYEGKSEKQNIHINPS